MLVAQRPLFKLRTVNVLLVHPTDDKCHESLLSGIFPILSHSTRANGVATMSFVVKKKQRMIQMLRIVVEWIDISVYELKYRVTYVRSECSIDPTSTIDWNQLFNRGRIYSSLCFAFYCREDTRMMERTWRSIRKSTLILLLPLLLAVSTIYDLFDD